MASNGAAEADFAWYIGVFGGGPLMPGVRRMLMTVRSAGQKMNLKKSSYVLSIIITLIVSCTQPVSITNPQNSNATDVQSSNRTALLLDGKAGGCSWFYVYKDTQDRTKVVVVRGGTKELGITKTPKSFDIENTPNLEVQLHDYGQAKHGEHCSDSVTDGPRPQFIKAASGRVTIFISREKVAMKPSPGYAITALLEGVSFRVSNGTYYYIDKAEIEDVVVGWVCC